MTTDPTPTECPPGIHSMFDPCPGDCTLPVGDESAPSDPAPTPAREMIRAPFTTEQVDALNAFQCSGRMHPFTCGADHGGVHFVLIARSDGWHCSQPPCDYRQDWAHPFMSSPEAWPRLFFPANVHPSSEPYAYRQPVTGYASSTEALTRCSCGGQGLTHLHADQHQPVPQQPTLPGATVTITIHTASDADAQSRAQAIADLVTAEFGGDTRLGIAMYTDDQAAPGYGKAIRDALRAAAYSCDGDCGLTERVCIDAHPVQVAAWTHDIVSDLYGPIDAIADVVHAVRDRETERLRAELTAERQRQERYEEEIVGRFNQQATELARRAETAEAAAATARRDGAREVAAMLRRTPRDSRDYPAVLTGARVIEDWLDGGAGGTPR